MYKYMLSLSGTLLFLQTVIGQVGGLNVYEFLNLPASARISALGGNLISVRDDDANLAFANPAALNASMHGQISFSHNFNVAEVQNGYLSYAHYSKKWDLTIHGGLFYIDYGTMDETNVFGETIGTFSAGEMAFTIGAGKEVNERLAVGANLKMITSNFADYGAFGLASDLVRYLF